eukprot:4614181-Prymnesium_polylepis.1
MFGAAAPRQLVAPRAVALHVAHVVAKLGVAVEEDGEEFRLLLHVRARRLPHRRVVRLAAEEVERHRPKLCGARARQGGAVGWRERGAWHRPVLTRAGRDRQRRSEREAASRPGVGVGRAPRRARAHDSCRRPPWCTSRGRWRRAACRGLRPERAWRRRPAPAP